MYLAPVDAEPPDMRKSLEMPPGWDPLTVTALLRQDPANHVRFLLNEADGTTIVSYDAAVARREKDGTSDAWDVLVEDSVLFKFSFDLRDPESIDGRYLGSDVVVSTNALRLASTRLQLRMHEAATAVFEVAGHEFVRLSPSGITEERRRELVVVARTLEDIVTIEHITGGEFEPCVGPFDDRDRVRLRQTRLMLEGNIVHGTRRQVTVTSPNGNPPRVVVAHAGTFDVGGATVPVPQVLACIPV